MSKTVRAIDAFVLTHPDGYPVPVKKGQDFDSGDPLVRCHAWAFQADAERDGVERATAVPGEKRSTRR